jgi:hypothetical protein
MDKWPGDQLERDMLADCVDPMMTEREANLSCHVRALLQRVRVLESAAAYRHGFIDGVTAFAWYRDGVQYVGTCGATLRGAIETLDRNPFYTPPQ